MDQIELTASDGVAIACYQWLLDSPRAVVQIAHGMGEHAQRYDWVAQQLNAAGFAVYANDHRGHGGTAERRSNEPVWGYMGPDGWNRTLADMYELNRQARQEQAGLPLILLGHSMGAMLSQQYITRYPASIDALALSGSPGFKTGFATFITRALGHIESKRLGPDQASEVLQNMLFGNANKPFDGPQASGFEWLSRDPEQVRRYVEDDACGFVLTTGSLLDMSYGTRQAQDKRHLAKAGAELPLYVMSGVDDPVHGEQKDIHRMLMAFTDAGLAAPQVQWYAGGRHEMFNETNRDEVVRDLVSWIDKVI